MLIVNGRVGKDRTIGNLTCFTHNGESTVDYLLTSYENFDLLLDFHVHDFNVHSNHAPVTFDLRINTSCKNDCKDEERFVYRWNPEHRDQFVHDVSSSINVLCSSLHNISHMTVIPILWSVYSRVF